MAMRFAKSFTRGAYLAIKAPRSALSLARDRLKPARLPRPREADGRSRAGSGETGWREASGAVELGLVLR